MKLLLTSAGITNQSIYDALVTFTGAAPKVAFILTAKNNREVPAEVAMENQTGQLDNWGIKYEPVDPSNDKDWKRKLDDYDVIMIGGGNTFHLLNESRITGFDNWVKSHKDDKVFVGTSAGSILMTPSIAVAAVDEGDENTPGISNLTGLGLIDFEVSPHTPEDVSVKGNMAFSKNTQRRILMIDNQSAVRVIDNEISIISEGVWAWCQNGKLT
jgi:dipeptidase E